MLLTLALSAACMAALFLMVFAAVALVQDKRLFDSAPKDIQERIQPHPERFAGARAIGWALLVIAVLTFPAAFIVGACDGLARGWGFACLFARFLFMLVALKAFDVLFLDWFLLTKSHFYQHYYPETEGAAGFDSFGFNTTSHAVQFILSVAIALVASWACTLL